RVATSPETARSTSPASPRPSGTTRERPSPSREAPSARSASGKTSSGSLRVKRTRSLPQRATSSFATSPARPGVHVEVELRGVRERVFEKQLCLAASGAGGRHDGELEFLREPELPLGRRVRSVARVDE